MPQGNLSHSFIVEFENEEDRNYYVRKDPAHLDFINTIGAFVARAQVLDFEPGKL